MVNAELQLQSDGVVLDLGLQDYDVASQLPPIQSRLQALKQHALFTDTMVPPVRK